MCNQSTWSNLWNCIRRKYLTIKNHQRKFYKILTSWRIQDRKTKLDDKKHCFYIPVKFLVTHEYKKPKRWHANMYMISQKNYNHLFATKHMWKAEKIKEITYPRKGTCVCNHLFITYPAVFSHNINEARPGIKPRTSDLQVRCPTDCATQPGHFAFETGMAIQ